MARLLLVEDPQQVGYEEDQQYLGRSPLQRKSGEMVGKGANLSQKFSLVSE